MALFWDTLFLKVYQTNYSTVDSEVLYPKLANILQMQVFGYACAKKHTFFCQTQQNNEHFKIKKNTHTNDRNSIKKNT